MMKFLLYPFSAVYGIIVFFRNRMYDFALLRSVEFDQPVISVGNITVGGTGKTPHVEYLTDLLKDRFRVAVLSRGYKRKTRGFRLVEMHSTAAEAGDEPVQIKNKFPESTVAVCENRVSGVKRLFAADPETAPDVVILDDAFQHRRITPGINILLIDYNRPLKKDWLLPAGRLREGAGQIRRANSIIVTKCPEDISPIARRIFQKNIRLRPYQNMYFTTFEYEKPKPVFAQNKTFPDLTGKKKYTILLVTGIASPAMIKKYLQNLPHTTEEIIYPDHHTFTDKDIETLTNRFTRMNGRNKIILTTEKDAIRFRDMENPDKKWMQSLYSLPVKVKFLNGEGRQFNQKILNYVGENKSNFSFHKRKNPVST
jgi:tetraacyldisaccharide 4'-kinase